MQKPLTGLTPRRERLLLDARWDGNVRELKNVIERACMLSEARSFPSASSPARSDPSASRARVPQRSAPRGDPRARRGTAPLEEIEREHIVEVLRQVNGNRMAAAKLLGISRRALYRRLERHHLTDEAPPPAMRHQL